MVLFQLDKPGKRTPKAHSLGGAGVNPGHQGFGYFLEGLVSQPSPYELGEVLLFSGSVPGKKKVHSHAQLSRKGNEGTLQKRGETRGDHEHEALRQLV